MPPDPTPTFFSTGDVCKMLGIPRHRLEYALGTEGIEPDLRAGTYRMFTADGVQRIRQAIRRIETRR